jgi:hypothetical protein
MKGMKGISMKLQIFALFFLFLVLPGFASADDSLYFYVECSPGQKCIDLAYAVGKTESVFAAPADVLGEADVKAASLQRGDNTRQGLNIELTDDASKRLEKITAENIGKRLMVVFDNKILTAPKISAPIADRRILIYTGSDVQEPFWNRAPWLQNLIKESNRSSGRSAMMYGIVAAAALISVLAFVVVPRMRRTGQSNPE